MSSYDPRGHTVYALPLQETDAPEREFRMSRGLPLKTYRVGPGTPTGFGPTVGRMPSHPLQRPSSAPRRPSSAPIAKPTNMKQLSASADSIAWRNNPHSPRFMDETGKWVQHEMPMPIAESQSQPLNATANFTAKLPGGEGKRIQPVSSVVSYLDVSPVATTEYVKGGVLPDDGFQYMPTAAAYKTLNGSRPGSRGRPSSADRYDPNGPARSRPQSAAAYYGKQPKNSSILDSNGRSREAYTYKANGLDTAWPPNERATMRAAAEANDGLAATARNNVATLWSRRINATEMRLSVADLYRTQDADLGQHVVPGSANSRLVGGRWRYMPRPVDGDSLFTDYYGPVGGGRDKVAYYGRRYNDLSLRIY